MDVAIRPLEINDLPALVRCFERGYGGSYADDAFYDPERLAARIADGTLRSVVAIHPEDGVVGHMALQRRDPDAATCDAGNTLVDPRHRGHRIVERLALALALRCRDDGFVGFHHYPTTAHAIMQKLAVDGGGVECGVLLAYIPSSTDYRGLGGAREGARLAAVAVYQPLAAAPARDLFAPPRYGDTIGAIAKAAHLERRVRAPAVSISRDASDVEVRPEPRRGLVRIAVRAIGRDLPGRVAAALADAGDAAGALAHVDLPLGDPAVAAAADELRALGFCFAAYLPEYRAGDVLRLQRLAHATDAERAPGLVNPGARALLALALREQVSVAAAPAEARQGPRAPTPAPHPRRSS